MFIDDLPWVSADLAQVKLRPRGQWLQHTAEWENTHGKVETNSECVKPSREGSQEGVKWGITRKAYFNHIFREVQSKKKIFTLRLKT